MRVRSDSGTICRVRAASASGVEKTGAIGDLHRVTGNCGVEHDRRLLGIPHRCDGGQQIHLAFERNLAGFEQIEQFRNGFGRFDRDEGERNPPRVVLKCELTGLKRGIPILTQNEGRLANSKSSIASVR